jgi:hypothetical protein
MNLLPFRKLICIVYALLFLDPIYSQRWIPENDFNHIKTFNNVLKKTVNELSIIKPTKKNTNEYFTNKQYDEIERLYFRYTLCTRSLLDIVNAYKDFSNRPKYNNNVQAFILGYCATLTIYKYSAELILFTANNQLLIDKLNEEYPRTDIKKDGLDYILSNLTNPDYLNNIDIANEFYHRQLKENEDLYNSTEFSPIIEELIKITSELSNTYENHKKTILDGYTILPLEAADIMQVTTIEETVNDMIDAAGGQLKAIQEFLFTSMANIRMPLIDGIKFNRRQKKSIKRSLKPGDIILTYSSGYLSNIFLPGYFKHVFTYTGIQNKIKNKYLSDIRLKPNQESLIKSDHDIIEANSDGVVTTKLDSYMNGYANRIIAFRPELSDNDIRTIMNSLYSFLGMDYDFNFDLTNGEKQTCSEIIYRSYNGIGKIDLDLEEIFGTTTLSGDLLLQYFMNDSTTQLIFLAVENERKLGKAKILKDEEAILYLKQNIPDSYSAKH